MNLVRTLSNLTTTPQGRAQGVDVYGKYQGYFRPELATQRIDFAIQKLTEGVTIRDPKMDEIWSGVKQIGMRGAYHYQRSDTSWRSQADYFLDAASKYDHHFFALDFEEINNQLTDRFVQDAYRILHYWAEQAPGKRRVFYSNYNLFETVIAPAIRRSFGETGLTWLTSTVDIWLAQYWLLWSVDKNPALPSWMKRWRIWQVTAKAIGPEFGVQSLNVDLDVYDGTAAQMAEWLGISAQPAPEPQPGPTPAPTPTPVPTKPQPEPEPETWSAVVLAGNTMIVREYPQTIRDTDLGYRLRGGATFQCRLWVGNGYVWGKISWSERPDLVGAWVAIRSESGLQKFIRILSGVPSDEPTLPPIVSLPQLYQVRHDVEMGAPWRPNKPEMQPFFPNHFTPFTEPWQRLSFEMNPHLTPKKWTAVYTYQRFMTNFNGFAKPDDPRANYITGEDLRSDPPKVESLTCGGALLAGRVEGRNLIVETLNGRASPPTWQWLKERPWLYFHAVTVDSNGVPRMFPQGDGKPVLIPLICDRNRYLQVTIPLAKLRKLDMSQPLPGPYEVPR